MFPMVVCRTLSPLEVPELVLRAPELQGRVAGIRPCSLWQLMSVPRLGITSARSCSDARVATLV